MRESNRLHTLLTAYRDGTLTVAENDELRTYLEDPGFRNEVDAFLLQSFRDQPATGRVPMDVKKKLDRYLEQQMVHTGTIAPGTEETSEAGISAQAGRRRGRLHQLLHYAAVAASVLLIFWAISLSGSTDENRQTAQADPVKPAELIAASNGAILTLADNSQVELDSAGNMIPVQGNTRVTLKQGQLMYDAAGGDEVVFNTLSTPRGNTFQLRLPDGSRVWLNAGSSIRFPSAFTKDQRDVELHGEAYFEVTHDATRPFHVQLDNERVTVLGTSFNVNSYTSTSRTTLIQGSVQLESATDKLRITPGQQAVSNEGKISLNRNADLEQTLGWRNGFFYFDDTPLEEILAEFERWYDIDVVYQTKLPPLRYFAIVDRRSSLQSVLKALKDPKIRFTVQGNKLTVSSG